MSIASAFKPKLKKLPVKGGKGKFSMPKIGGMPAAMKLPLPKKVGIGNMKSKDLS